MQQDWCTTLQPATREQWRSHGLTMHNCMHKNVTCKSESLSAENFDSWIWYLLIIELHSYLFICLGELGTCCSLPLKWGFKRDDLVLFWSKSVSSIISTTISGHVHYDGKQVGIQVVDLVLTCSDITSTWRTTNQPLETEMIIFETTSQGEHIRRPHPSWTSDTTAPPQPPFETDWSSVSVGTRPDWVWF